VVRFRKFELQGADHRVEAVIKTEIESRIDGYDKGEIEASPAEEVMKRIYQR
jgi:putative addiction module component (TIGR02574 family)